MVEHKKQELIERVQQLCNAGGLEEAKALCVEYSHQNADDADVLFQLGVIAQRLEDYSAAVDYFSKVLMFSPQHVHACFQLGKSYALLDEHEKALHQYESLEQVTPESATLYYQIANLLRIMGRHSEAEVTFRKVLQLKPDYVNAYVALSRIKRFDSSEDADIAAMVSLLDRGGLPEEQLINLYFALAKAFEDLRDYDQAFDYLAKGNSLKRQGYNYDVVKDEMSLQRLKDVFTLDFFRQRSGFGVHDDVPIFIVGMPRSGSTLVEQVLSMHPDVFGAGEIRDLGHVIMGESTSLSLEQIGSLGNDDVCRFARKYIKRMHERSGGAPHVTNKMLVNFQWVGIIRMMFPNAKIVHCVRDPVDTCLAIFRLNFFSIQQYAYDLVELGRYYRAYGEMMAHWHQILPGYIYDISYEGLIMDQVRETQRLLEYCGLAWDEACLSFYDSSRAVKTASLDQVRQPLYQSSVQKWRHYERHLEPLQHALAGECV